MFLAYLPFFIIGVVLLGASDEAIFIIPLACWLDGEYGLGMFVYIIDKWFRYVIPLWGQSNG
jgi:hypothetical protein